MVKVEPSYMPPLVVIKHNRMVSLSPQAFMDIASMSLQDHRFDLMEFASGHQPAIRRRTCNQDRAAESGDYPFPDPRPGFWYYEEPDTPLPLMPYPPPGFGWSNDNEDKFQSEGQAAMDKLLVPITCKTADKSSRSSDKGDSDNPSALGDS